MKMLVCESIETFEYFIKKKNFTQEDKSDWVMLTTDYQLFMKAEELHLNIMLLDSNEPVKIYETTRLLKQINKEVFASIEKSYLAEFNYSIEGAGIEQNIADLLYNYEFCKELFECYNINYIYLFCNVNTYLECEIIKEIAKEKNVHISIYYGSTMYQGLKNKLLFSNTFFNKGIKYLYYLFKIVIKFTQSLVISLVNQVCRKREHAEYELGVVWASDAIKHMNWCKEKIETYNTHLKTNIICKFTKQSCMEWKKQGMSATLFDDKYLQLKECVIAITDYLNSLRKMFVEINNFQLDSKYEYLSSPIKHRIWQHVLINVPNGFVIDAIAKNFYKWNQYQYIETWLGSNNIYSRIAYYNTRREETVFFRILPGDITIMRNPNYEEVDRAMLSWCFFIGKTMKKLEKFYKKSGWNGEAICLNGKGWDSKKCKKVGDVKFSILWAPSYPLKGYFSEQLFNKINDDILREISLWDVNMYVKYHPSHSQIGVNNILNKYRSRAIIFESKDQKIEDLVNKVDLVITTGSSVIVDSIKASTPVIVIRDGDLMQMDESFAESKAIFWDTDKAIEYLKILVSDKEELERLFIEENKKMLEIYGEKNDENCYVIIVNKIKNNQACLKRL